MSRAHIKRAPVTSWRPLEAKKAVFVCKIHMRHMRRMRHMRLYLKEQKIEVF